MFVLHYDCGTSRTRGYLLLKKEVVATAALDIGSKTVSIHQDKSTLKRALLRIMNDLCAATEIDATEIKEIYASGMITSPYGLEEADHLTVPVSISKIKENIVLYDEGDYLKRGIKLLRGVKTSGGQIHADLLSEVNNVRGEEIETFGIISNMADDWKNERVLVVIPGSHTHGLVVQNNSIVDILSTFSGEVYAALSEHTILKGSISQANDQKSQFDSDITELGDHYYREYGFARAVYIVHASKIFDVFDEQKRAALLSSIITASVVDSFCIALDQRWHDIDKIMIYGDQNIADAYAYGVEKHAGIKDLEVRTIYRTDMNCSVAGLISLLED